MDQLALMEENDSDESPKNLKNLANGISLPSPGSDTDSDDEDSRSMLLLSALNNSKDILTSR